MINICIEIFFARIFDVSLNTIRTFFTLKGKTIFSTIISFFEILIWFIVARKAINVNIDSICIPISYALGYSTGNLIGGTIINYLIKEKVNIMIVTKEGEILSNFLRERTDFITEINLKNKDKMFIIECSKKDIKKVLTNIKRIDKNAHISISDIHSITQNKKVTIF